MTGDTDAPVYATRVRRKGVHDDGEITTLGKQTRPRQGWTPEPRVIPVTLPRYSSARFLPPSARSFLARLGRVEDQPAVVLSHRPGDEYAPAQRVDVAEPQGSHLAPPQTCVRQEPNHQAGRDRTRRGEAKRSKGNGRCGQTGSSRGRRASSRRPRSPLALGRRAGGCRARHGLAGSRPGDPRRWSRTRRTTASVGRHTGRGYGRSSGPSRTPPPVARSTSMMAGTAEGWSNRTRSHLKRRPG
jgi:hypothetical protein